MDKLSLYDLFTYLLPGICAVVLLNFYSNNQLLQWYPFNHENTLIAGSVFLCVALCIGALIQSFIMYDLVRKNWYGKLLAPSVSSYPQQDLPHPLRKTLLKEYNRLTGNTTAAATGDFYLPDLLFDYLYYLLETNDKIAAAKGEQSFYFLFRNMATLMGFCVFLQILNIVFALYNHLLHYQHWVILSVLLIAALTSFPLARWFRGRMVKKICWHGAIFLDAKNNAHDKRPNHQPPGRGD